MKCFKIGAKCPHQENLKEEKSKQSNNLVFVLMPFDKEFKPVYRNIKKAVKEMEMKCDRADKKPTTSTIWCKRICSNIQKAKYIIADTTGKNANVFYEIGIAHALDCKVIIITRNIEDAPFDIKDISHIIYSEEDLEDLKDKIIDMIEALKKEEEKIEPAANKTKEENIKEILTKSLKEFKTDLLSSMPIYQSTEKETIPKPEELNNNQGQKRKIKSKDILKASKWFEKAYNSKDDNDRIKFYTKALELNPNLARAYYNRGASYALLKENNKAIADFNKAIEIDPNFAGAYLGRSVCYNELKDFKKALADFNKAIELNPNLANHAECYCSRGVSYNGLKEFDKAIADFNKAIELNPNLAKAYLGRGTCYKLLKEDKKGDADFAKANELDPDL